jgi:hypothetical protein
LASSGDTITVAAATYTENLTIGVSLTILGSGTSTTIVDGGGVGQVVSISSRANVTLSGMEIRHGVSALYGGGIGNYGTLTLSNSIVTGNVAGRSGGSVHEGGGIYNGGRLTINSSTISGNTTSNSCPNRPCFIEGGGIFNGGRLTINNSTINENSTRVGSAIYNIYGTVRITNTTISGNLGKSGLAAVTVFSYAGTLTISNSTIAGNQGPAVILQKSFGSGVATLQNSIIANNVGVNCGGVTSNGYNLSSDTHCNFNGPGDKNDIDPRLGPLQNNGGPTLTMSLPSGSPAVDGGNPSGCTDGSGHLLKTDQRGMPRPDPEDTGGCDMGAYERQSN